MVNKIFVSWPIMLAIIFWPFNVLIQVCFASSEKGSYIQCDKLCIWVVKWLKLNYWNCKLLKSYFMYCSCVVIILFNTDFFFFIYSFIKLVSRLFVFCVFFLLCFEFNMVFIDFCVIIVYKGNNYSVVLFTLNYLQKHNVVLEKTCF